MILKVEGGINIICPDYIGTFEGYYSVPWLPLFPKRIAKVYLRILKKPIYSLDTLQYITRNNIIKRINIIGKENSLWKLKIFDVKRKKVEMKLKRRRITRLGGITCLFFFFLRIFKKSI